MRRPKVEGLPLGSVALDRPTPPTRRKARSKRTMASEIVGPTSES
eukprot:COSAG02_NODE_67991_length_251_cov_1.355263_1_plen_44_part_01